MTLTQQLWDFVKPFGVQLDLNVVERGKQLFDLPRQLLAAIDEAKLDYYSAGIPLGQASAHGFHASIALLEMLRSSKNRVMVSSEGEWMFICGRDVFESNISRDDHRSSPFLVVNDRYEVIGLGSFYEKKGRRFLKPILDRGDFLRREERRKKRK